jgi:hypothetical protein
MKSSNRKVGVRRGMMAAKYSVLSGINYGPDGTRAEVGDVLPDGFVDQVTIDWAISIKAIALIADPASTPARVVTPAVAPVVIAGPIAIVDVPAATPATDPAPTTTPTSDVKDAPQAPVAATEAE